MIESIAIIVKLSVFITVLVTQSGIMVYLIVTCLKESIINKAFWTWPFYVFLVVLILCTGVFSILNTGTIMYNLFGFVIHE